MSTAPRLTPPRPQYAPLQSSSSASSSQDSSTFQSYTSSQNLAAPAQSASAAHPLAQTAGHHQQQSPSQGPPQGLQMPQMPPMQRYRSFEYQPNRDGAGRTAAETQTFLNQAALLAEAAKRAQMAVVMRDLDSMEL